MGVDATCGASPGDIAHLLKGKKNLVINSNLFICAMAAEKREQRQWGTDLITFPTTQTRKGLEEKKKKGWSVLRNRTLWKKKKKTHVLLLLSVQHAERKRVPCKRCPPPVLPLHPKKGRKTGTSGKKKKRSLFPAITSIARTRTNEGKKKLKAVQHRDLS